MAQTLVKPGTTKDYTFKYYRTNDIYQLKKYNILLNINLCYYDANEIDKTIYDYNDYYNIYGQYNVSTTSTKISVYTVQENDPQGYIPGSIILNCETFIRDIGGRTFSVKLTINHPDVQTSINLTVDLGLSINISPVSMNISTTDYTGYLIFNNMAVAGGCIGGLIPCSEVSDYYETGNRSVISNPGVIIDMSPYDINTNNYSLIVHDNHIIQQYPELSSNTYSITSLTDTLIVIYGRINNVYQYIDVYTIDVLNNKLEKWEGDL